MASNQQQQQAIGQEERRVDKKNKANGSTTVLQETKGASKMECSTTAAAVLDASDYGIFICSRSKRSKRKEE